MEKYLAFSVVVWGCFNIFQSKIFDWLRYWIEDRIDDLEGEKDPKYGRVEALQYLKYFIQCPTCLGAWLGLFFSAVDWALNTGLFPFSSPALFFFGFIFGSGAATVIQGIMVKLWPEEFGEPPTEDQQD